ncbi:hypothetical protein R1flu_028064 [Riccia fluitans]|uniref:Uncharacterized protein n=1 Tax=Riccia fluitans TaxID=41844 RepID=A0ABD1XNJ8_9MARC
MKRKLDCGLRVGDGGNSQLDCIIFSCCSVKNPIYVCGISRAWDRMALTSSLLMCSKVSCGWSPLLNLRWMSFIAAENPPKEPNMSCTCSKYGCLLLSNAVLGYACTVFLWLGCASSLTRGMSQIRLRCAQKDLSVQADFSFPDHGVSSGFYEEWRAKHGCLLERWTANPRSNGRCKGLENRRICCHVPDFAD